MVWHPCGSPKQLQCILSSDGCGCPLTVLGHLRCVRKQIKLPCLNCACCNLRWALNSHTYPGCLEKRHGTMHWTRRYPHAFQSCGEQKLQKKMWLASIASKMGSNWPVCHFLIQCCSTRAVCREEFYWKERERVARTNITKVMQTCQPLAHFSICACHPCAGAMLIFSVSFQFYCIVHSGIIR